VRIKIGLGHAEERRERFAPALSCRYSYVYYAARNRMFAENPAGKYPDKSAVPQLPKILLQKDFTSISKKTRSS
jgi:hypothetical protein